MSIKRFARLAYAEINKLVGAIAVMVALIGCDSGSKSNFVGVWQLEGDERTTSLGDHVRSFELFNDGTGVITTIKYCQSIPIKWQPREGNRLQADVTVLGTTTALMLDYELSERGKLVTFHFDGKNVREKAMYRKKGRAAEDSLKRISEAATCMGAVTSYGLEDSLKRMSEATTRMGAVTSDTPIEATVNIAGTDGERYLKAAIIIEYDEKNIRLGNELRQRTPQYRDIFINQLSTLTLMEITEPGARDKIRADLVRMINNNLHSGIGEIHDVLFTTYIIQ